MGSRRIKLFVVLVLVCTCGAVAATLASGEYAVTNGSFEDSTSMAGSGWQEYPEDDVITISTDSSQAYYGTNSAVIYRNGSDITLYNNITVVDAGNEGPHVGETVEAGVWVMFDTVAAGNAEQLVLEVKSFGTGGPATLTVSSDIQSKQADKWYYVLAASGDAIPSGAEVIQIAITSHVNGTVYVDFAQAGLEGSITGNPSKLALAEYHTWFGVPDYLPDSRRYTDPDYDGFSSYDPSGWEHWEWHWDSQSESNHDPAF